MCPDPRLGLAPPPDANFGVEGGVDVNGACSGHLNHVDPSDPLLHVESTSITSCVVVNPTTRRIEGSATADGVPVTFPATVSDAGEPGTADAFAITSSNGHDESGTPGRELPAPRRPIDRAGRRDGSTRLPGSSTAETRVQVRRARVR
jgi:hypothetical protein